VGASGGTSGEGFALIIAVWKPADIKLVMYPEIDDANCKLLGTLRLLNLKTAVTETAVRPIT